MELNTTQIFKLLNAIVIISLIIIFMIAFITTEIYNEKYVYNGKKLKDNILKKDFSAKVINKYRNIRNHGTYHVILSDSKDINVDYVWYEKLEIGDSLHKANGNNYLIIQKKDTLCKVNYNDFIPSRK